MTNIVACAILIFATGGGGQSIQAAPVSFAFQATVTSVQGDPAAQGLPFPLINGQVISGKYTFASDVDLVNVFLHTELGNMGELVLTVGDSTFASAANFGLLNSAAVLDPPIVGPTSSIALGYQSPTNEFPGWPPSLRTASPIRCLHQ